MTDSLLSRIDLNKKRLEELQDDLVAKGEEVRQKGERWSQELRDKSLVRFYDAGSTTLTSAADLLEKVPFGKEGAERLRESAKAANEASAAVERPPIDNYDELNVGQVQDALEGLSAYELEKVRTYEKANKDRVTVLREVEQLLS